MADYTTYTTRQGDRWDNIAYAAYGDVFATMEVDNSDSEISMPNLQQTLMEAIINANPTVPITAQLPSGIELRIPIVVTQPTINEANLPPWKR